MRRTRTMRSTSRRARRALALAASVAGVAAAFATPARAADSSELWPEVSAFVRLDDQKRLYLDASYAKATAKPAALTVKAS